VLLLLLVVVLLLRFLSCNLSRPRTTIRRWDICLQPLRQRGLLPCASLVQLLLLPAPGQGFNQLFLDGPGEGRQHGCIHLR
jgi:hypothetical protein